jgi:CRISP-associated protein Cas1
MSQVAIEIDQLPCTPEPASQENPRYEFDKTSYDFSCFHYEQATDRKLRHSGILILSGYDAQIKVKNGSLVLQHAQAHTADNDKTIVLERGVHGIKTIILLSDGGYISIPVFKWLIEQGVTMYLLDWQGDLLQVLTPAHPRNAKLAFLQFVATTPECVNSPALPIAVELVRLKTVAQIETLEKYPDLAGQAKAIKALEAGLHELHKVPTIEKLRTLEGRLAMKYFACFTGFPIKWERQASKVIPSHWLSIEPRNSKLSSNGTARNATNPYHAVLNYSYSLLEAQCLEAIIISGLDPTIAFLHAFKEGRNSLVYDILEPFRAAVDDAVFSFFCKSTFKRGDFYQTLDGSCRLNEQLRRYVLASCKVSQDKIDSLVLWLKDILENHR